MRDLYIRFLSEKKQRVTVLVLKLMGGWDAGRVDSKRRGRFCTQRGHRNTRKFVPVDFAETRAEAVAFSEQQVAQGDEVLEKLSRTDENALTDQAGELAHEVPKGLEVSKLGVAY